MDEIKSYLIKLGRYSDIHAPAKISDMPLADTCSPFEGIPQRHPQDNSKIILYTNPFIDTASYYEFPVSSIGRIEEIDTISAENGISGIRIRLWIKKGTKGVLARAINVE